MLDFEAFRTVNILPVFKLADDQPVKSNLAETTENDSDLCTVGILCGWAPNRTGVGHEALRSLQCRGPGLRAKRGRKSRRGTGLTLVSHAVKLPGSRSVWSKSEA